MKGAYIFTDLVHLYDLAHEGAFDNQVVVRQETDVLEHEHVVEFDLAVRLFNGLREVKEFLIVIKLFPKHPFEIDITI